MREIDWRRAGANRPDGLLFVTRSDATVYDCSPWPNEPCSFDRLRPEPSPLAPDLLALGRGLEVHDFAVLWSPLDAAAVRDVAFRLGLDGDRVGAVVTRRRPTGYVAYASAGHGPAGPNTVRVGGDCVRDQVTIADALRRAAALAREMRPKAMTAWPGQPVLHGGKKSETLVLAEDGSKIEDQQVGLVALALLLPRLIGFLNRERAQRSSLWRGELPAGRVLPETMSPDVGGALWPKLLDFWVASGVPKAMATCLPGTHGGFGTPSADPTGLGVATAVADVVDRLGVDRASARILLEALGGVASYTVPRLVHLGFRIENMVGFDPDRTRVRALTQDNPGLTAVRMDNDQAYSGGLVGRFDVLVNNGLGDQLGLEHVEHLVRYGVRAIVGGANTILRERDAERTAAELHAAGVVVVPGYLTSIGGYTMAVMGQFAQATGVPLDEGLLDRVRRRVTVRVKDALEETFQRAGQRHVSVWQAAAELLAERVARADAAVLEGEALERALDPRTLLHGG